MIVNVHKFRGYCYTTMLEQVAGADLVCACHPPSIHLSTILSLGTGCSQGRHRKGINAFVRVSGRFLGSTGHKVTFFGQGILAIHRNKMKATNLVVEWYKSCSYSSACPKRVSLFFNSFEWNANGPFKYCKNESTLIDYGSS